MDSFLQHNQVHPGQYVSVRPGFVSEFYRKPGRSGRPERTDAQIQNELNLQFNEHDGKVSTKANRKVRQSIDWILYLAISKKFGKRPPKHLRSHRFKINFITLTLSASQRVTLADLLRLPDKERKRAVNNPEMINGDFTGFYFIDTDNEIKSTMLNHFLVKARKYWGVSNYLWRAEPQGNGRIHFHIVTDKFIPWRQLRSTWNSIQNKLGYVDRFTLNNHGKKDPNSVDVHAVWKIKYLAAYLAKYCAKDSPDWYRPIYGRLWGQSSTLSNLKAVVIEKTDMIEQEFNRIKQRFAKSVNFGDFFTTVWCDVHKWKSEALTIYNLFQQYVLTEIDNLGIKLECEYST